MYARYFDDFVVGEEWSPPARTVTEGEVMQFAQLSGDFNPVHVDRVHAEGTRFEGRIAHGLMGMAFAGGFLSRVGVIDGHVVAMLDTAWRFKEAVRFGDTIRARIVVAEARLTSRGDTGVVRFEFTLANQHGATVQEGHQTFLMERAPQA